MGESRISPRTLCWRKENDVKRQDYVSQDELPEYREEHCPTRCPILGHVGLIPVVDHDHQTGRIRGILSAEGNALIGKIENFHRSRCVAGILELPEVLRNIADYLEQEQGPLHPKGTLQVTKRFGRKPKSEQVEILLKVGAVQDEITACKNSKQRTKLYRKKIVR